LCQRQRQSQKANPVAGTRPGNLGQFAHERRGVFAQVQPTLSNPYLADELLQDIVIRHCPPQHFKRVSADLTRMGERIVDEIDALGDECEANPPTLQRTDAWGNRVDKINCTRAWFDQHRVSAEEGLIAIGYERESGAFSRVHQMAKNLLYGASSGLYNCPLAMTDGAAVIAESQMQNYPFLAEAFESLTTREAERFWTSGQWMTEKAGGSDVGQATMTEAKWNEEKSVYELFGYKWFTSAITSDMTLTLARIHDESDEVTSGTRGLSMFFMKVRNQDGELNGIQVHKLKEKLGTRQLPTAELILEGAEAHLVGTAGRGIPLISSMLTVTRIHNAVAASSAIRRMTQLARDYAQKRTAFSHKLSDQSAHVSVLARMEIEARAAILLSLEVARLFGKVEMGEATPAETDLMRILTPLAKLQTAKQSVSVCSEGLECFGGQGYIEETPMPRLFRDSQVLPIWEGTSTVMSLDVLRAIQKSKGSTLRHLFTDITQKVEAASGSATLAPSVDRLSNHLRQLSRFVARSSSEGVDFQLKSARDFAFSLAKVYQAALLLDHATYTSKATDAYAANHFSKSNLDDLLFDYSAEAAQHEYDLVFANYHR